MLPKDPEILVGYINLKLRDMYSSIDALCDDLDEDKNEIEQLLKSAGYKYDEATNQYR